MAGISHGSSNAMFSAQVAVAHPDGGWMRLEDYCNSGPRGIRLIFTAGCLVMQDEVDVLELGERVTNAFLDQILV